METEVRVPKWGLTIQQVHINVWLKSPGDRVEEGEPLCTVETDKSTADIEAPQSGTLGRIVVEADQDVDVGGVVCTLTSD